MHDSEDNIIMLNDAPVVNVLIVMGEYVKSLE